MWRILGTKPVPCTLYCTCKLIWLLFMSVPNASTIPLRTKFWRIRVIFRTSVLSPILLKKAQTMCAKNNKGMKSILFLQKIQKFSQKGLGVGACTQNTRLKFRFVGKFQKKRKNPTKSKKSQIFKP